MDTAQAYKLVKEETSTTPFVEIKHTGFIKMMGNLTSDDAKGFVTSLFWGVNKIISNQAIVMVKLDLLNEEGVLYMKKFFQVLVHHIGLDDINILWMVSEDNTVVRNLGEYLKSQYPIVSFQFMDI